MKSKFCSSRNNNEGFSLVELIIVIAIMVALVAMLAPQFVKYVAKSRDAVVTSAAQDVLSVAKAEYALGHLRLGSGKTDGTITVQTNAAGEIIARLTDMDYTDDMGNTGNNAFEDMCGIDKTQHSKSEKVYLISVINNTFIEEDKTGVSFETDVTDGGHSDTVVTEGDGTEGEG